MNFPKKSYAYREDWRVWQHVMTWTYILVGVVLLLTFFVRTYGAWRETDSVIKRAQVAADAEDMLSYLKVAQVNFVDRGMTEGYSAAVLKGPSNDLSLTYQSIGQLIERLEIVKDLDHAGTAYQVAMDDLRDTLTQINGSGTGYVWAQTFPVFAAYSLILVLVMVINGIARQYRKDHWKH